MRTPTSLRSLALFAGVSLANQACGPKPPPPPPDGVGPDKVVQQPVKAQSLTPEAEAAFRAGVTALQATPADYAKAVESFEKATTIWPDYPAGLLNLAFTYEKLGRHADAAVTFRKLIKLNANDSGVALALGRSLLLSGEPEQAITEFESVLRKDPNDLKARNNLAAAYLEKGDNETSLRYVKEVLAVQPRNVPAIVNLGLLYLKQKKLPLALLMFNKAISYEEENEKANNGTFSPDNLARAQNNLGLTYYAMQIIPLAVTSFEKAIALSPSMDESRLNVASIYLDYLDYGAALPQFRAVLDRFPKHYQAMVGEADALYGTGDYAGAAKVYQDSLALKDNNPEVLLRTGKLHEEQLGKPKEALPFYKKYRDVINAPANHPINQTIQFLEQMDDMKAQPAEPEPAAGEGQAPPAEGAAAPGSAAPGSAAPAAAPESAAPAAAPESAAPAAAPESAAPAGEPKKAEG